MDENYVPSTTDIWDFLVGLKQATEAGFGRLEARLDRVELRLDGVESRLDRVESRLAGVESRLDGVESRLDGVETRLDRMEHRLIRICDRVGLLENVHVTSRFAEHERRIAALEQRRSS